MSAVGEQAAVRITAVIPLFDVERYVPDLLESLSCQAPGDYDLEVIFVDDGSPDRSGDLAAQWLVSSGRDGRVIRQKNAGVSAARNAGMDAAAGEWITFPDSDDMVDPGYFRAVARFIRRSGASATIASARLLRLREPDPNPRDVHALSFRFAAGDRVIDIERHPDFFQLNVASAFFPVAELRAAGVRFRPGLHASEDALFVAEFLLGVQRPRLGLVARAEYHYRKRSTQDSAVDRFRSQPETYFERFESGYLPLMRRAVAERGAVPEWLQSMFLYECQWLLPVQLTEVGYANVLDDRGAERTRNALAACMEHVTTSRLFAYDATALPLESRLVLLALGGRELPAWVDAICAERGSHVITTHVWATSSEPPTLLDSTGRAVEASTCDELVPDYFGQQGLRRFALDSHTAPSAIRVDGTRRTCVSAGRGTVEERADRTRRRATGQTNALDARSGDVRVWKPVQGPGGRFVPRLRWNSRFLLRRTRRWLRR